jgi:hypothetical protein
MAFEVCGKSMDTRFSRAAVKPRLVCCFRSGMVRRRYSSMGKPWWRACCRQAVRALCREVDSLRNHFNNTSSKIFKVIYKEKFRLAGARYTQSQTSFPRRRESSSLSLIDSHCRGNAPVIARHEAPWQSAAKPCITATSFPRRRESSYPD